MGRVRDASKQHVCRTIPSIVVEEPSVAVAKRRIGGSKDFAGDLA